MTQLTGSPEGAILLDEPPPASAPAAWARLGDLYQLTKPRIAAMVVITAYVGFEVGRRALVLGGPASGSAASGWGLVAATLTGTALSCMGASALNQVLERDVDARMPRTMGRPLPAGRLGVPLAAALGLLLAIAGVGLLAAYVNTLTAALAAFTVASYVLIYTPLKRVTHLCTAIGAVPGALPPVMGYAAATGELGLGAWLLFAILFLWQLPHFLAIAWLYRDDYAAGGMPMLPVIDPDGRATCRQILLECAALLPLGLMPTLAGLSGVVSFIGALAAGLVFLGFGVALVKGRTRRHARALFFASLVYLPVVYGLILFDRG